MLAITWSRPPQRAHWTRDELRKLAAEFGGMFGTYRNLVDVETGIAAPHMRPG